MSTFTGYYLWSIITKDEEPRIFACFGTRKACLNWLKMRREEAFFETGSMDYAEEKWGVDNFKFEEVFVMNRESFIKNFGSENLGVKWDYDI